MQDLMHIGCCLKIAASGCAPSRQKSKHILQEKAFFWARCNDRWHRFCEKKVEDFSSVRRQERTNCYGIGSQHMIVHVRTSYDFFGPNLLFPFEKYIIFEESDSIFFL